MNQAVAKKSAVLLAIGLTVLLFKFLDLDHYLTLEYLQGSREKFVHLYQQRPVTVIGLYMLTYILVTGLSLPGATLMTLAGGALFELTAGTIIVSFASSIGATLACLVSRFLLRDWVQSRFGDKLTAMNAGIAREGAFYLFSLRLVPLFPFFIINLVMGITRLPLFTYYWISQIGMLPATLVYVNAGKELGKLESMAGILSPGLIASFAVLGLFPLTTKKLLALYQVRRKDRP